jgi:hypothetical protein
MTRNQSRDMPRPEGKKRALLYTNIWRYVVDNASQGPLLRLAREGSYDIQIAPAVLYETLRLGDAQLRTALVRLMTNARFHRLMPEAYSESMEVLQEIERVRPDWLRDSPDVRFFDRLKKDWTRKTGGFWVRCVRSLGTEVRKLSDLEGDMMKGARAEARLRREEAINSEWKRIPPLDETLAALDRPLPGWRGDMKCGDGKA